MDLIANLLKNHGYKNNMDGLATQGKRRGSVPVQSIYEPVPKFKVFGRNDNARNFVDLI